MTLQDMPTEIAILPLDQVILFPRACLPLHIFEPRYIKMIEDAFANKRLIGIIQPKSTSQDTGQIFSTGCVGRITHLSETEDGHYHIDLVGICRFNVIKEKTDIKQNPYRTIHASWSNYDGDFSKKEPICINKERIIPILKTYLEKMEMCCDKWDDLCSVDDEKLISSLSMICPLPSNEKQALLETKTLHERTKLLETLLKMAIIDDCPRNC